MRIADGGTFKAVDEAVSSWPRSYGEVCVWAVVVKLRRWGSVRMRR